MIILLPVPTWVAARMDGVQTKKMEAVRRITRYETLADFVVKTDARVAEVTESKYHAVVCSHKTVS